MSFYVVVPARYASTRLPGKPLADIAGKTMVERVAERCQQSGADQVYVATDDARIADVLGDTAGLALADGGVADGVQQSRLAVVDVTHDGDHRRAELEVLLAALVLANELTKEATKMRSSSMFPSTHC